MNNAELAHIWANELKDQGRGSNMFFEGKTIYSYGYHFPIASIIEGKRDRLTLFTSKSYSNTTSKHKGHVIRAITTRYCIVPDVRLNTVNLGDMARSHEINLNYLRESIEKTLEKASRSRVHGQIYIAEIEQYRQDFIRYAEFFKPKMNTANKKMLKSLLKGDYIPESLRDKAKYAEAKAEAQRIARQLKIEAEQEERLQAWINGADLGGNMFYKTCLRVKDGFVETSRGAKVSVESAKVAYKALLLGKLGSGYNIDGYTVISVNGTLKIGCHEIPIEEVHRIGNIINA